MSTINGPPQESTPSDESMAAGPQAHLNTEAHRGKDLFNALVPVRAWMQDKQLRSWIVVLLVVLVAVPAIGAAITNLDSRGLGVRRVLRGRVAAAALCHCPAAENYRGTAGGGSGPRPDRRGATGDRPGEHVRRQHEQHIRQRLRGRLPEELSKMVPVLVIAMIVLFFKPKAAWLALTPQDYLFLGAVSGAVFGASEAVHYVVTQLPAIIQQDGGISIAGVQQVVLQFGAWRFLTDPISHACWAGIAGYFVGLAIQEYHKGMIKQAAIALGCIGMVITSVLHGFNDWVASPAGFFFVLVNVVSVLLFLGYARVGASPDALQAAVQAPLKVKEEEEETS